MKNKAKPYGWLLAAMFASLCFYFAYAWVGSDIVHVFDRGSLWDRLNGVVALGSCLLVAAYGFTKFILSFRRD